MVLIGLRIQIFPTIQSIPADLKLKLENNLRQFSIAIMQILKDHYEAEAMSLDKEILEMVNKLSVFLK